MPGESGRGESGGAVWAIDPGQKSVRPDPDKTSRILRCITDSGMKLWPVSSVVGRLTSEERERLERDCRNYIDESQVRDAVSVEILFARSDIRSESVSAVLDFAEKNSASLVVLSSHGRSGLERWVFGSFAESLLLQSRLPVLFLTNQSHGDFSDREVGCALFATDFSNRAKDAYRLFLDEAKRLKLRIVLFHEISIPLAALVSRHGVPQLIPSEYFVEQREWSESEGASWVKMGDAVGVDVSLITKQEGVVVDVAGSVYEVAASWNANFIVVACTSGTLDHLIFGSVAQDVYRSKRIPIWVYGPKSALAQ